MHTLTRRGLLVVGGTGAAGAVLAACGTTEDERDEGRDPELLAAALARRDRARGGLRAEANISVSPTPNDALNAFAAASEKRAQTPDAVARGRRRSTCRHRPPARPM